MRCAFITVPASSEYDLIVSLFSRVHQSGESCLLVACKYCRTDVVSYLTDVVGAEVELDAQDEVRTTASQGRVQST